MEIATLKARMKAENETLKTYNEELKKSLEV